METIAKVSLTGDNLNETIWTNVSLKQTKSSQNVRFHKLFLTLKLHLEIMKANFRRLNEELREKLEILHFRRPLTD